MVLSLHSFSVDGMRHLLQTLRYGGYGALSNELIDFSIFVCLLQ